MGTKNMQWKRTQIYRDGSAAIYDGELLSPLTRVAAFNNVREADLNLMTAAPALLDGLMEAKTQIRELCVALGIPTPDASFERYDKAIAQALGHSDCQKGD